MIAAERDDVCTQSEHARVALHALTMRWGAGASLGLIDTGSLGGRAALALPFEVYDGRLWCLVVHRARQQVKESDSSLSPAAE